jgi:hypothetical protein
MLFQPREPPVRSHQARSTRRARHILRASRPPVTAWTSPGPSVKRKPTVGRPARLRDATKEQAAGQAVDVGQVGVLPQLSTWPVMLTWVYQSLSSSRSRATRGSWRMCSSRLRPSSTFTSTRPSSRRYQVAVDTGRPSRRRVAMTAGSS